LVVGFDLTGKRFALPFCPALFRVGGSA